jgi:hypothetical protein
MITPRLVACADCGALKATTVPDCFCGSRDTRPVPDGSDEKRSA